MIHREAQSASEGPISLWDLPTVTGKPVQARRPGRTVGELEDVERRAYEEAFAKGREAGLAAAKEETQQGRAQLQAQIMRMEKIISALAQPLQEADEQVEGELVTLALTIARQLIRRELRMDSAQVIAIIRETVALLPAAARDVRVHLHPEDAAVVRDRLSATTADRAWSIVEDPVMTRGGCRVSTDTAQIDARLETRINGVIAAMFGEQRAANRAGEQEDE